MTFHEWNLKWTCGYHEEGEQKMRMLLSETEVAPYLTDDMDSCDACGRVAKIQRYNSPYAPGMPAEHRAILARATIMCHSAEALRELTEVEDWRDQLSPWHVDAVLVALESAL